MVPMATQVVVRAAVPVEVRVVAGVPMVVPAEVRAFTDRAARTVVGDHAVVPAEVLAGSRADDPAVGIRAVDRAADLEAASVLMKDDVLAHQYLPACQ